MFYLWPILFTWPPYGKEGENCVHIYTPVALCVEAYVCPEHVLILRREARSSLPGGCPRHIAASWYNLSSDVLTHSPDYPRVAPTRAPQHRISLCSFPGLGAVVGGALALPHGGDHLVMILLVF